MYRITKPADQIDVDDLQRLLDERVRESKTIEYKQTLYRIDRPANGERLDDQTKQKRENDRKAQIIELLKDASSFANTIGGYLFLGIKEGEGVEKGVPVELCGVECENPDAKILQMTQLIEDGIAPRIQCDIHAVALLSGRFLFVIRVLDSTHSPHRVEYDGHGHFYSRNSAGAGRMDTSELRRAFTMTDSIIDRLKAFQRDRIKMISAGEQPVRLLESPRTRAAVHLIPFQAFSSSVSFSVNQLQGPASAHLPMLDGGRGGGGRRINLDGLLSTTEGGEEFGYTQLFRNGIIEAVDAFVVPQVKDNFQCLNINGLEENLVRSIPEYVKCLEVLGVIPPLWCFVSLVNTQGVWISTEFAPFNDPRFRSPLIESPAIALPEAGISDFSINLNHVVRPLCDMIRNAFNQERSPNFDADGNFRLRR